MLVRASVSAFGPSPGDFPGRSGTREDQVQTEGTAAFEKSWRDLLGTFAAKR